MKRKKVALLIESSRAYGRGLLRGIASYLHAHPDWSVYLQSRSPEDPAPPWLDGWDGDGIIARVESRALGAAILAFMPDAEREATVSWLKLKRFTPATIATRKALETELADIRAKGYALDRAEGMAGIHCVAAPILDAHGHAIAAITIAGPQERVPESDFARVGALMRAAAADVAFQFGGAAS